MRRETKLTNKNDGKAGDTGGEVEAVVDGETTRDTWAATARTVKETRNKKNATSRWSGRANDHRHRRHRRITARAHRRDASRSDRTAPYTKETKKPATEPTEDSVQRSAGLLQP